MRGRAAPAEMGRLALLPYAAVASALLVLFLGYRVVSGLLAERRGLEDAASNKLLYDTEMLARSLDSLLRIADTLLADSAPALARTDERGAQSLLAALSGRLPEARNAYLFDSTGRVLASAWQRSSARLDLPRSSLDRLALSGAPETLIAGADAEGGPVLATMLSLPSGRGGLFCALLFSASVLEGRLSLTKEAGESEAIIMDSLGRTLGAGQVPGFDGSFLRAETALRTHPLRVRMYRDLGPALQGWRRRSLWQGGLGLALLLVAAGLSFVALAAGRKARRAAELERELGAKELLFHEINHRVKNNLSVVQSILSIGAGETRERPEAALGILLAASDKVQSMTMLHEQLYKRQSLDTVDLGLYFVDLAGALNEAYGSGDAVSIEARCSERLEVDLATAVPLALIVTELATNAFKHAFPAGRPGRIIVAAQRQKDSSLRVEVRDDGIGKLEDLKGKTGFGQILVHALAQQLEAGLVALANEEGPGLCWRLELAPRGAALK